MPTSLESRRQVAPTGAAFFGTPQTARDLTRPIECFAHHEELDRVLTSLARGFGRRHWWPAESAFEIIVGAVLTQNTAWGNVELALANLRTAKSLEPAALFALCDAPSLAPLETLIRPSGAFRQKAKKLAAVTRWLHAHSTTFDLTFLATRPLEPLREDLLSVFGIGPETADSILCYAAGRRTAVVDAYTRRILERHSLVPNATDTRKVKYEALRTWLQEHLVDEQLVYEEFHALIVVAGYDHCKPTARCETCPAAPAAP